jgi:predicted O-methyltransferase YrrM
MPVTSLLRELDPSLHLHNEGHWDQPFDTTITGFASYNDAGLEAETGEFLYGLLRVLKPKRVLETGSHVGVGAAYLGMALKKNKYGILDTIEFLPELHFQAVQRIQLMELIDYVKLHFGDVAKFDPGENRYQFILLDTEPQTRFAEFEKFWPYLDEGGFLFIH